MARWDRLFEDLEAQLAAEELRELRAEVADRTRRERSLIDLQARLLGSVGRSGVAVRTPGLTLQGRIKDAGPDWLLLDGARGSVLIPYTAVRSLTGVGSRVEQPSLVAKGFGFGMTLRALSRNRLVVEVADLEGRAVTGTIDGVGADHLELAEHPADEPRRLPHVRTVALIPFASVGAVAELGSHAQ